MSSDLLGIPPTHLPDDPAAGPLEDGEVAAHRLGGDAELLGGGGDAQPAALTDQHRHGLLPFLGVHGSPSH